MSRVTEFLKKNPIFYLATVEENQPRVRPFGAVMEYEGKLYITTSNQKSVFEQMRVNKKVEMSTTSVDGEWVRITGEVKVDSRREAREAMLEENPDLEGMYQVDDGKFEVLYFEHGTATFYSFTNAPETVNL